MIHRLFVTLILVFVSFSGVFGQFSILLGVYPKPCAPDYFAAIKLPIQELKHQNGYYQYRAGSFKTYLDAELQLAKIKSLAFDKASVLDLEEAALMESSPCPYEIESLPGAINTFYLLFDGKTTTLTPVTTAKLKEIAEILRTNQLLKITITGHTDSEGPAPDNMKLAGDRARTTRDYLMDQFKIPAARIYTMEEGEAKPLLPNSDEFNCPNLQNRAKNNRATVTVHL
jgi:outer membrane protein OmpA-like peptidoglycan-associated protein